MRGAVLMEKRESKLVGRSMSRAYLHMYAVDSTQAERACIAREIEMARLEALSDAVQQALGIQQETPFVNVVFFGQSMRSDRYPGFVQRHIARIRPAWGAWIREIPAVFMFLTDGMLLRRMVAHELTHALLSLFTDDFPLPRALTEGTALNMEWHIPARDVDERYEAETPCSESGGRTLKESKYMSIRELLRFDQREWSIEHDGQAYYQMAGSSWFLLAYLAWLRPRLDPAYGPLLAELRRRNVTDPSAVQELMARMYRMEVGGMEEGFRTFCMTGKPPGI
jgi:hypothetical protein